LPNRPCHRRCGLHKESCNLALILSSLGTTTQLVPFLKNSSNRILVNTSRSTVISSKRRTLNGLRRAIRI
jgi:hypothetical protein